jgi:hypothetical protein
MQRLVKLLFIMLSVFPLTGYSHDLVADTLSALIQQDTHFVKQFHQLFAQAKLPEWAKEARGVDSPFYDISIGNKNYVLIQTTSPDHSRSQNLVILLDTHTHKMWAMFETYDMHIIEPNTIKRQWFGSPNYTQKRILLVSTIESIH